MNRIRPRLVTNRATRGGLLHRWLPQGRTIWIGAGSGLLSPYGVDGGPLAREANERNAVRSSPEPGPIRPKGAEAQLGRANVAAEAEATRGQTLATPIIAAIAAHRVGAWVGRHAARPGAELVEGLTAPGRGGQAAPLKGAPASVGRDRPHGRQGRGSRPRRRRGAVSTVESHMEGLSKRVAPRHRVRPWSLGVGRNRVTWQREEPHAPKRREKVDRHRKPHGENDARTLTHAEAPRLRTEGEARGTSPIPPRAGVGERLPGLNPRRGGRARQESDKELVRRESDGRRPAESARNRSRWVEAKNLRLLLTRGGRVWERRDKTPGRGGADHRPEALPDPGGVEERIAARTRPADRIGPREERGYRAQTARGPSFRQSRHRGEKLTHRAGSVGVGGRAGSSPPRWGPTTHPRTRDLDRRQNGLLDEEGG